MARFPSIHGTVSPAFYAVAAPALILSQHALAVLAHRAAGVPPPAGIEFWLLPLRSMVTMHGIGPWQAGLAFAFSLAVAWALGLLSFRRASRSRGGFALAALSVVPAIQLVAVPIIALLPTPDLDEAPQPEAEAGADMAHVIQGILAGVAIIVLAVLISAVTFGAYGWGLFVLTPFTVGVTTGYLANRRVPLPDGRTTPLVLLAAGLGSLALIMFALEGLACIVLASPLGALAAFAGGAFGRGVAKARHARNNVLMSVALLPAAFAADAVMPPSVQISTHEAAVIAAPPPAVWRALTSDAPLEASPGLVGWAGLAYAVRGRILSEGVGGIRLGEFSTGMSRERITTWAPERRLAFDVLEQPAAMEEMSPYRQVHAPHVHGYFNTRGMSFDLEPLPGGRTRVVARASHVLRIDPVLYWGPLARWAVRENTRRVLRDIEQKALAPAEQ